MSLVWRIATAGALATSLSVAHPVRAQVTTPLDADSMRALLELEGDHPPDVLVQGLFDQTSQHFLLDRVREILTTTNDADPLNRTFDRAFYVETGLGLKLAGELAALVESLIGFPIEDARLFIQFRGLRYEVGKLDLNVGDMRVVDQRIDQQGNVSPGRTLISQLSVALSQVRVTAESITLRLVSPRTTSALNRVWLRLERPWVYSERLAALDVNTELDLVVPSPGELAIRTRDTSFKSFEDVTAETLKRDLDFDPGTPAMASIAIQTGGLASVADEARLPEILKARKAAIARLMFKPLADLIHRLPETVIRKRLEQLKVPTRFPFVAAGLKHQLRLHSLGRADRDQMRVALDADLEPVTAAPHTSQERERFAQSERRIAETITSGRATLVVSVSDRYLSRLAQRLAEAQLAKSMPPGTELGPMGIRLLMEDRAPQGAVVADVQAKLGWPEKWAIGKSRLRFPLVLYPRLGLQTSDDGHALLTAEIQGADRTQETLLFGGYGIPSNLHQAKLLGVAAREIARALALGGVREAIHKLIRDTWIQVPIADLDSFALTFVRIESDGLGRLNILLNLNPGADPTAAKFWRKLPETVKQWIEKL